MCTDTQTDTYAAVAREEGISIRGASFVMAQIKLLSGVPESPVALVGVPTASVPLQLPDNVPRKAAEHDE